MPAITVYAATLVGASALAQWNTEFSDGTTRMLWRIFSVFSASIPLVTLLGATTVSVFLGWGPLFFALLCFHSINRLILIILVLYSFRSLPSDTYESLNWLEFIPFFS